MRLVGYRANLVGPTPWFTKSIKDRQITNIRSNSSCHDGASGGLTKKLASMVERLRRSLEKLESPIGPDCQLVMRWTRSTLVGVEPTEIIHVFTCLGCRRVEETKSIL